MDMKVEIVQINDTTWSMEEQGVRFFLLTGTKKALLIDSGMMVRDAKEIAEGLTDLPVELLNTHADVDHVGSNGQFEAPFMHPAELSNYHKSQGKQGKISPVWDGDRLDLGDRPLEIIAMPGHTPGSIAVLDKKYGMLFSGDPIQDGKIFMFGVQRELEAYCHSLARLGKRADEFEAIYPSHGTCPVTKDMIEGLYQAAQQILAGEATSVEGEFMGNPLLVYDMGIATFLCDAKVEK